jgi:hypothetical protein
MMTSFAPCGATCARQAFPSRSLFQSGVEISLPGYDVTALVEKSGKLLQLIPNVAEAFVHERITASHANLIVRLPQEDQADAFEQCLRKDWQDKEPHLLPAKHLSVWIQACRRLSPSCTSPFTAPAAPFGAQGIYGVTAGPRPVFLKI